MGVFQVLFVRMSLIFAFEPAKGSLEVQIESQ
jgi:hypothetical protein